LLQKVEKDPSFQTLFEDWYASFPYNEEIKLLFEANGFENQQETELLLLDYILLLSNTDVNAQNIDGNTVLHFLAESQNPALIESLLDAGANPYLIGDEGLNVFESVAMYNQNPKVIKVYMDREVYPCKKYIDLPSFLDPFGVVQPIVPQALMLAREYNPNPEISSLLHSYSKEHCL